MDTYAFVRNPISYVKWRMVRIQFEQVAGEFSLTFSSVSYSLFVESINIFFIFLAVLITYAGTP